MSRRAPADPRHRWLTQSGFGLVRRYWCPDCDRMTERKPKDTDREARGAPAPEGLRAAIMDALYGLAGGVEHQQGEVRVRIEEAAAAIDTVLDHAAPPSPAEPPRRLLDALLDKFGSDFDQSVPFEEVLAIVSRAEARPPEGLDAALVALERMREFAEHDRGCIFAVDLSGVNGDEWQEPNARPCNCGFDAALALYDAALATRLSAGGATTPQPCPYPDDEGHTGTGWEDEPASGPAGGATKPTLGNRPDVAKPRVAKATRGAKGAKC